MKPKVGLITYCVGNQGSALQCYATQTYLAGMGIDCTLYTRRESGLARIGQSLEYRAGAYLKLLKYPDQWSEYKKCKHPKSSNVAMSKETLREIEKFAHEYIRMEQYSWNQLRKFAGSEECMAFFSGSDQIWSGFWFLTNRLWFLRFCPKRKRVAWMPSFGTETVSKYNEDIYRQYISEYQFLSVREASGQKIVQGLTGRTAPVLPDPVYLLSAEQWRAISIDISCSTNYILMFFISQPNESVIKYAQKEAERRNAQIIWLSYNHDQDGLFINGGPREFVSYIDKAELVLTDSFHAALFSIILDSPFYVYQRTDSHGSKQIGRIHNLLEKFQMQSRFAKDMPPEEDSNGDYERVREVLESEKNKVDLYLKEITSYYLGDCE